MGNFVSNFKSDEQPAKVDSSASGVTYVGYPLPGGAGDAQPKWAIKRITSEDDIMTIEWAEGTLEKRFAWSERASLDYRIL